MSVSNLVINCGVVFMIEVLRLRELRKVDERRERLERVIVRCDCKCVYLSECMC